MGTEYCIWHSSESHTYFVRVANEMVNVLVFFFNVTLSEDVVV